MRGRRYLAVWDQGLGCKTKWYGPHLSGWGLPTLLFSLGCGETGYGCMASDKGFAVGYTSLHGGANPTGNLHYSQLWDSYFEQLQCI